MAESNHNQNDNDPEDGLVRARVSRRAFFKGAGAGAVGTVLLESGRAGAEEVAQDAAARASVLGPGAVPLSLTVNGRSIAVRVDPGTTLVELLRDELDLTGTKVGCDRGACSACTVWVNGEVRASCMTLALDVRGARITTIEGLAQGDRLHPVQQAFVEHDALQCGFCTPGMVMSCAALVERNPRCTLDDVRAAVSGHLCRCGTYPNVFTATLAAAARATPVPSSSGDARRKGGQER